MSGSDSSTIAGGSLVAQLNPRWRVVAPDDGTRWILEQLHDGEWHEYSRARLRYTLECCIGAFAGAIDPQALATIAALPATLPKRKRSQAAAEIATTAEIASERDECDDDYPGIITQLNAGWRVIAAPDGTQWILQRQRGAHLSADDWRARAYFRTRYALARGWSFMPAPSRSRRPSRSSLRCPAISIGQQRAETTHSQAPFHKIANRWTRSIARGRYTNETPPGCEPSGVATRAHDKMREVSWQRLPT